MKIFSILLVTISILLPQISKAGVSVGVSNMYTKINDPSFDYVNEFEQIGKITSVNVGYTKRICNYTITASTNRLLNKSLRRQVVINNYIMTSKTKIVYDSLQLGYMIKRFSPSIFLANTKVTRSITGYKAVNHAFVGGVSLGYFLTKKINISAIYLLPNQELYLKSGFGVGVNYLF